MSEDMRYFPSEDVLHISIHPGRESGSVEISPNITAELNEDGELIGVEILEASKYLGGGVPELARE